MWIPGTGSRPDVELSCRSGKGRSVDCVSGNVRVARVRPLEPLVLGETYEAVVNPPTAPTLVVDRSANPVPTATRGRDAPEVGDDSRDLLRWHRPPGSRQGGRYAVEHRAGATASFAFEGGTVTWYTAVGPDGGKAAVSIDGVRRGAFDAYAARADFGVGRTFDGLGPGAHTITIRVLGRERASATDTQVIVDAFRAGGKLVANPDLRATWGTVGAGGASGGSLGSSDLARRAPRSVRGTGIEWLTYRGTDRRTRSTSTAAGPNGGTTSRRDDVRRVALDHRLPEASTRSDRGAGDRSAGAKGAWSRSTDSRSSRNADPSAPAARAMRSAASSGSRTSVFTTRS